MGLVSLPMEVKAAVFEGVDNLFKIYAKRFTSNGRNAVSRRDEKELLTQMCLKR